MKRILVTGGNAGIGKALARKCLENGHAVVITSRSQSKGDAAVAELKQATGKTGIELVVGDLSSIQSTLDLANSLNSLYSDIAVLINNAGVWQTSLELNADGLEMSFMVNHVAPHLLAQTLMPQLKNNTPARIVNVNAGLYVNGKVDLQKTPTGDDFSALKTYATSKLCSVLITLDMARELEGSGVSINAVHPGVINTGLGDSPGIGSKLMKFIKRFWKSPDHGAEAPYWLAVDPELEGVNGKYFDEKKPHDLKPIALDRELQVSLRELTDRLIQAHSDNRKQEN